MTFYKFATLPPTKSLENRYGSYLKVCEVVKTNIYSIKRTERSDVMDYEPERADHVETKAIDPVKLTDMVTMLDNCHVKPTMTLQPALNCGGILEAYSPDIVPHMPHSSVLWISPSNQLELEESFGYSGRIFPLEHSMATQMVTTVEQLLNIYINVFDPYFQVSCCVDGFRFGIRAYASSDSEDRLIDLVLDPLFTLGQCKIMRCAIVSSPTSPFQMDIAASESCVNLTSASLIWRCALLSELRARELSNGGIENLLQIGMYKAYKVRDVHNKRVLTQNITNLPFLQSTYFYVGAPSNVGRHICKAIEPILQAKLRIRLAKLEPLLQIGRFVPLLPFILRVRMELEDLHGKLTNRLGDIKLVRRSVKDTVGLLAFGFVSNESSAVGGEYQYTWEGLNVNLNGNIS